jgi:gliding-associated putative ABC transporter substrate-binding component GldG
MNKKQTLILSTLTFAALFLALLVSTRLWVRLDLSKTKAYTISKVSRSLADEITEQVEITYFVSGKLKQLYPQPNEIEDLIREYTTYSRGKIRFTVRDPAKDGLEDRMQEFGIPAQQMQIVEHNEAAFSMVYSGLLIEYLDKNDVIPVVFSIDTLEYDITSRIRALVRDANRQIGVLLAESGKTLDNDFSNLARYLTIAGYKIRPFNAGEEIPDDFPLLIVVGGMETLDDWSLYRLDYYIQQGGKVLFCETGVIPDLNQGLTARKAVPPPSAAAEGDAAGAKGNLGLLNMLAFYGAKVKDALLLDPSSMTTTFNSSGPGGATVTRLIRYPFWVNALPEFGNPGHPVTSGFGGADLYWPSPVELAAPSGIEGTQLFSSTPDAWLQTKDYNINPDMSYSFTAERDATKGTYALAVSLSGKQQSFFRGKKTPERAGGSEFLPDMPAEAKPSRIIVAGDIEFVGNQFNQSDKNFSFVIAACDWLSNDDDIIGIRSRAPQTGRLEKILDQEKRIAAFAFVRILNTVLVPLIVLAIAFILAHNRRVKAKKITMEEN